MKTNTLCLENPATAGTHVQYALQLKMPETTGETRLPVHFILLMDVSESMLDRNKHENVKHSAGLVLKFLGPTDYMSIITFGEKGKIQCNAVRCDASGKSTIESILQTIHVDGCTNLSAGLSLVKSVMSEFTSSVKTGVLLLTDGHANRGVYSPIGLKQIIKTIHEQFPALSFNYVGYGTDHNSELLKDMAEQTQSGYTVVEDVEGASTVIGDTLGGLFSCAAQMVTVFAPAGTKTLGQFQISVDGKIEVGDLYDGSETVILLSIPKESVREQLKIMGVQMPSLHAIQEVVDLEEWTDGVETPGASHFRISVDLTGLRYQCSSFFRRMRHMDLNGLSEDIQAFRTKVFQECYNDNPVAMMLREECISLETAFANAQQSRIGRRAAAGYIAQVTQHEAYTNLGRGVTRAFTVAPEPEDPVNPAHVHFNGQSLRPPPIGPLRAMTSMYVTTPFSSHTARRVTNAISTMTVAPNDPDAIHEAMMFSQSADGDAHTASNE